MWEAALVTTNANKIWRDLGKKSGERTWNVEISKGEIPGSRRSMQGYILTYSKL